MGEGLCEDCGSGRILWRVSVGHRREPVLSAPPIQETLSAATGEMGPMTTEVALLLTSAAPHSQAWRLIVTLVRRLSFVHEFAPTNDASS